MKNPWIAGLTLCMLLAPVLATAEEGVSPREFAKTMVEPDGYKRHKLVERLDAKWSARS